MAHLLIGTLLAAGGTLALNQYLERDVDARMERTRRRPLPAGRLQPLEALLFAGALTSLGVVYLAIGVGVAAAAVTLATTILYIGAYTPLKLRTASCMLVGAVPGALPPVTGWLAAGGDIGLGAAVLFAILFLWQLPHTLAIARLYADDYARGGVRVLAVVDPHGTMSERQIVSSTLALIAVSVLPEEREEHVPVPAMPIVAPARVTVRSVERFALGEDRHRLRVPVEVQPLSAGLKGGLVGGCAMALCAAIYGLVVQHSVWYPLNLLAAIAMPRMAEADAATLKMFDGAAFVVGLIAHGVTSALVGALYAAILPLLPRRHMLWGGLIAPLLWSGFLWATLGVIDPALNAQISWTWFIASQIAFGLTAGYVVARATPVATAQTRSFPARAGVEATGLSRHEDTRP